MDTQQKIERFAGQVVTDLAASMAGVMTNLGHKLGLYRAMAEGGPINSDELARRTATNERSVREWLNGQVAGGYVLFDRNTNRYVLPPEHNCWLFTGTEAFFRNGYRAQLMQTWIPSLRGVWEQLVNGGRVADVGCGHGASVILMA